MALTPYLEKTMLDWALGGTGGAVASPAQRYFQFASSVPDANNAYDGPFTNRMTVNFGAAANVDGEATVSNGNALVRTATAAVTAVGWNIYDAAVAGNRLMYGTMTAGIGCGSGDGCRLTAGNLVITLA